MSILLELLGKGLDGGLLGLVLPGASPLKAEEVEHLELELSAGSGPLGNRLRLAVHYGQMGANMKAENLFKSILAEQPDNVEARLGWAWLYASWGDLEKALNVLSQGYEQIRSDVRILYGLGYCHERLEQLDEALRFYTEAAQGGHGLRTVRERLAALALYRNDYPQAIEHCLELHRAYPEDVWLYLVLGQLYLQTAQNVQAADVFERALTIEPDNFDLTDEVVYSLAKSGRLTEAIAHMEQMIAEHGEFPDSFVQLGDLYCQAEDDEAAVRHYRKAMALHPEYLEAAVKLGTQHLRMGRYFESARQFNRAVEINDRLIGAYVGLGIAQHHQGHIDDSRDTIDLALALEPNTNLLFAEMARLQLKVAQGHRDTDPYLHCPSSKGTAEEPDDLLALQIKRHQESLRENPNQADLHYRYGMLLRGQGQIEDATYHLQMAVRVNPSYGKAKIKLGLALWEQQRHTEAIQHLAEALTLTEEYRQLHYRLGILYCDKIHFALTVEHFAGEFAHSPDQGNVEANLQLALQNMGLIDRATATWRALCELAPGSTMAFQAQRSAAVGLQPLF